MPDKKNQNDTKPDNSPQLPTSPPKQPRKDYSVLPQKPITLKREITTSPSLKKSTNKPKHKAGIKAESKAKPKSTMAKRPSPANQWTLHGISQEARDAASTAAEREGLKVGKWLEWLILEHVAPKNTQKLTKADEALISALKSIDDRLSHLENQRGFWIRFWDRFMEQR